MTDLVNHNQAIFDAIAAATSYDGGILINVKKFIETFNNHRDRALCTSLHVGPEPSSTDIVERLRAPVDPDHPNLWTVDKDRLDAAVEIERLRGVAQTRCSVCGSGDAMVICEGCWTRRPAQAAPVADEIDRLRKALELLTDELPEEMHTLDEPDEDWEVIVKMRAIAREALSPPRQENNDIFPGFRGNNDSS